MIKIYITSLFILFFSIGFSQSYPYLNASTGNENEFPVDKDTSIFMFHGNRLVKTDKNFNTVWANTYSGFTFSSLLLSKTGSIYFIGQSGAYSSVIGKINPNGSLNWTKNTNNISAILSGSTSVTYTINCHKVFLDRNNNLMISGSLSPMTNAKGFLIKMDTSGNAIKFKSFNSGSSGFAYCDNLSILNDSAGYYKIIGGATPIIGPPVQLAMHSYSDLLDAFTQTKNLFYINIPFGFGWKLAKSKFQNNFYIQTSTQSSVGSPMGGIAKFGIDGQMKWSKELSKLNGSQYAFSQHLEECNSGDLFYSTSTGNTSQYHTHAFIKLDSNGVVSGSGATAMLKNYNIGISTPTIPNCAPRVIHYNNYYFDVWGQYFATNPLTVQKFNSSLTYTCSSTVSYSITSPLNFVNPVSSPTLEPITSYTIPSFSSTATPVTFSVNSNFCIVLDVNGISEIKKEPEIYPNPANDKIWIKDLNFFILEIKIYDINGKIVKVSEPVNSLDISKLLNGIYFIHIKTDKGEFNKKFVKE